MLQDDQKFVGMISFWHKRVDKKPVNKHKTNESNESHILQRIVTCACAARLPRSMCCRHRLTCRLCTAIFRLKGLLRSWQRFRFGIDPSSSLAGSSSGFIIEDGFAKCARSDNTDKVIRITIKPKSGRQLLLTALTVCRAALGNSGANGLRNHTEFRTRNFPKRYM
jgi:hypothetical protein